MWSRGCHVAGPNCCISMDRLAFFFQYEFQSTAVKNLAHLAQSEHTFHLRASAYVSKCHVAR